MRWSTPYTVAVAALAQLTTALEFEGFVALIEVHGAINGNDGSLWLKKDGSSVTEGATNGDYIDATGLLPDGTTYAQQTSHSTTVTTTTGFSLTGSGSIDFGALSAEFSISQSVATTTSETETITITVKCNGQRGRIQFQPLFTKFDGTLCQGVFCAGMPEKQSQGTAFLPEDNGSGGQLANFRVQCEDGSIAPGSGSRRRAVPFLS